MFKQVSIRWRMTILSAILLTICCVGLTIVLRFSAFTMVDTIDAAVITDTATEVAPIEGEKEDDLASMQVMTLDTTQEAKAFFTMQSLMYMLLIITGGSTLTYYVAGKAIKPLDVLTKQVKHLDEKTLCKTLAVPNTKDEIAELTQSFNDMTAILNRAFSIQKHFSASAAHELRTPLAVLQTRLDVFKKKNQHTKEEYENLITVFEKQIQRLRSLVTNLLDMDRLH